MSDRVGELLRQEADRRVAGEQVPPLSAVHARLRRQEQHARRWRRVLPVLAGAAVLAVALGAQQLTPAPGPSSVAIPPPPELGTIVPPLEVRARLGAPGGHVNGPPVAEADLLAVAPSAQRQPALRTVGVVRPRPKPDPQGRPLVDRCVYTYGGSDAAPLHGSCQWARPAALDPEAGEISLVVNGAPGRTFLTGTAPSGTAALRLTAPGQPDTLVATGPPGPQWNDRPHYVVWWPRVGTDVTALSADGAELARTRLPSSVPVRDSADDPELGTVELSLPAQQMFRDMLERVGTPTTVDVLAELPLGDHITLYTYGHASDGTWCTLAYLQDFTADAAGTAGGGGSCGSVDATAGPPLRISRSYSAGSGEPGEQTLSGSAPPGTARIVLSSPGLPDKTVPVFDAGPRWDGRMYFLAAWPSSAPTQVRAVDSEGRTKALFFEKGMNPDAFDPEYLAAFATCLERHGVIVTRHEQGQGAGPAYEYGADLPPDQMRQAEADCEAEAAR